LQISLTIPVITAPHPAQAQLEFKNTGSETLWLYRPIQSTMQPIWRFAKDGGSRLSVHLKPVAAPPSGAAPGPNVLLSSVSLPHPQLVRVAAGAETTENVFLELSPLAIKRLGQPQPLWGKYRLSVTYRASYPNAAQILQVTGLNLWQGKIRSNFVAVTLQPSGGRGSITGSVSSSISQPLSGRLVTLTTAHQDLLDQTRTDPGGEFAFRNLPWGLYWVFAHDLRGRAENLAFRHAVLKPADPTAHIRLMLLPKRVYQAKRLLHEPVLLRVVSRSGGPLGGVQVESLFDNERVVEKLQGRTAQDGAVGLALIPGRNIITLRQRGCRDEERLIEVPEHRGVSAFEIKFHCRKKK
jgi:hypothetical protein